MGGTPKGPVGHVSGTHSGINVGSIPAWIEADSEGNRRCAKHVYMYAHFQPEMLSRLTFLELEWIKSGVD